MPINEFQKTEEQIWEKINNELYDEAYTEAIKLNRKYPGSVDYILGLCYTNGWGTQENLSAGLAYFKSAIANNSEDTSSAYLSGAYILHSEEKYEEAIHWFEKAESMGEKMAVAGQGMVYATLASELRMQACKELNISEYKELNCLAIDMASKAIDKYKTSVLVCADDMSESDFSLYGDMTIMLYNMACRGEINPSVLSDDGYLVSGMKMFAAKSDENMHSQWLELTSAAAEDAEKLNFRIAAEYIRAKSSLLDSELHNSANAFYRAIWHFKRIGELLEECSEEEKAEYRSMYQEADKSYKKMNKRYGVRIDSMIRNGEYPDLSPSFCNNVPEVESCERFMRLFDNNEFHEPPSCGEAGSVLHGIFGSVMRLFGKDK